MKLALLLLALPAFGQIRATYEPLAESETKRATGVKTLTLWNVTVESTLSTINRGDVERLTAFTELRPSMAEDLIRKSSGANGLTLLGKGWDGGAGFVATGLTIGGYAAGSKETIIAGGAVAVVTMFRNLLKGQAPDGTQYLPEFMPDVMTCKAGYCGNFLVLTSKIGSPVRVEVGTLTPNLIALGGKLPETFREAIGSSVFPRLLLPTVDAVSNKVPASLSIAGTQTIEATVRSAGNSVSIVTHPQTGEVEVPEIDSYQIATWVRERSAACGGACE